MAAAWLPGCEGRGWARFDNDGNRCFLVPGICLKRPANDFMLDRASLLTVHIWSKLQ